MSHLHSGALLGINSYSSLLFVFWQKYSSQLITIKSLSKACNGKSLARQFGAPPPWLLCLSRFLKTQLIVCVCVCVVFYFLFLLNIRALFGHTITSPSTKLVWRGIDLRSSWWKGRLLTNQASVDWQLGVKTLVVII